MTTNLENLDAVKMGSIQDAVNAAVKASRDLINLPKQSLSMPNMRLNGRNRIVKRDFSNLEIGMRGTWNKQDKCLLILPRNICLPIMGKRRLEIDLLNGTKNILENDECMTEPCTQSKQEKSCALRVVHLAVKNAFHMHITRTTQNLMKSFGCVLTAISNYIINTNITVREQARKLCKQMRCSELLTKAVEIRRNDVSPRNGVNRKWQAGGKSRFIYLPPGFVCVQAKSSLIVLNSLTSNVEANKVQAAERWAA